MRQVVTPVEGFPGYGVDHKGNVWSRWARRPLGRGKGSQMSIGTVWRRLKPTLNKFTGYLVVGLYRDGKQKQKRVHNLVLSTLIGPCPPGMECRHLDGKKHNCRLSNLAWGTPAQNTEDKFRHGSIKWGEDCVAAKLTNDQVKDLFTFLDRGFTQREVADLFGISQTHVSNLKNGKRRVSL